VITITITIDIAITIVIVRVLETLLVFNMIVGSDPRKEERSGCQNVKKIFFSFGGQEQPRGILVTTVRIARFTSLYFLFCC